MNSNSHDTRQTSSLPREIEEKISELRSIDYRDKTKIQLLREHVL